MICLISVAPNTEEIRSSDDDESSDGSTPEFTVLLHGSLKTENMIALVKLKLVSE